MNTLLLEEHQLLGALLAEDEEDPVRVLSYGAEVDEVNALRSSVGLADLGGVSCLRMAGAAAPEFASAAFAGRNLAVGECAFQAVLLGDGAVASIPLLARTGGLEYVCWDFTRRSDMLGAWLSFLVSIEQAGEAPFASVSIDESSDSLSALGLWGPRAQQVLADYLQQDASLPMPGSICELRLDSIPALVMAPPSPLEDLFVVLVPPQYVRILWRSFLSFQFVQPVGEKALLAHAASALAWLEKANVDDKLWVSRRELEREGLVRGTDDFVGANALNELR